MRLSLKTRLITAALTPTLVLIVAIGALLMQSRVGTLEESIARRGDELSRSLVPVVRDGIVRGDLNGLQELARVVAQTNPELRSLTFTDEDGEILASERRLPAVDETPGIVHLTHSLLVAPDLPLSFRAPVKRFESGPPVGWVTVELSLHPQARSTLVELALAAAAALLAIVLGLVVAAWNGRATRRDARPVVGAIQELERGRLDTRVGNPPAGELGELSDAVNAMARAMQRGQLELQRKVEQTTSELRQTLEAVEIQNVELDLARKRALEASKVKSEFLANMSHEIRTPINGILGFADLLSHSPVDDEQRDYVNTIKESCSSLLAIVNDILDFSKIEAGKLVIDNVAFDLRDCVEEVLSLLAPAAYGKSLELVHLIYADVPLKLYGDPIRIRQVLTNLVHNAIKFTPAGRVVVRVMLEDESDQDAVLRLSVTDTGIGLSPGDQQKLFKAFGQADTSITRRFGGAGLGLIISRKLVEQMGGTIGLESEPAKGSTFWFTLRCIRQRLPAGTGIDTRHTALNGRRVLLYDEEPLSRLAVKHTCDAWGIKVTEVEDHASFVSLITAQSRWDAAIIGLTRGELNAWAFNGLVSRLRNVKVPLVVLASTVDRHELRSLFQQGARAALPKAVRRQTLYRELCRLLTVDADQPVLRVPVVEPVPPAEEPPRPPKRTNYSSARVLVVDDNHINRKLVLTILGNYGVTAAEAEDGKQAVDMSREQEFDLILMDIHMPVMSGETAARQIKARPQKGAIPKIVALTANAMPGERERLLAAGMNDCLIKPITEEQLLALLHSVVPHAATGADTAPEPTPTSGRRALTDELREMLVAELPDHKRAIQKTFRGNQLSELKDRVHTLHGAASVCRLAELRAACASLEKTLSQGDRVGVPAGVARLLGEIDGLLGTAVAAS